MEGTTVAHYQIRRKLGSGGMGVVYLAEDTSLGRQVAIKFLPEQLLHDEIALKRFVREARSAAAIDHPYICNIFEVGKTEDGRDFIVMEYVEGQTLQDKIFGGVLPPTEALRLATEVAEALELAHSRGIVHRDLKPVNIMLTPQGHAKVMDFGLAKRVIHEDPTVQDITAAETVPLHRSEALTEIGTTLGTIAYMSPEQLRGESLDLRSDLFSFGIVFYEMLTGVHPFRRALGTETAASILRDDPAPLSEHRPALPPSLQGVVGKMLAKDPVQRYNSAAELETALRGVRQELREAEYLDQARAEGLAGFSLSSLAQLARRPMFLVPVVLVVAAMIWGTWWYLERREQIRYAREELLPKVSQLVEASWRDSTEAYRLAVDAERIIPGDPVLADLIEKCSLRISIRSEPGGARVSMKEYGTPEGEWQNLGVTPLEDVRLPISVMRWKMEKDGYQTVYAATSTWDVSLGERLLSANPLDRTLDPVGSIPEGMVRVQGATTPAGDLPDFFIDRYEVTNRLYQEFVDKGGYRNANYWKYEFSRDGRALSFEEAMAAFVDQTGRPGPATWQAGSYPEGQEDYPVSGVSWYEAAAYAEFVGRALPTGHHWGLARGEGTAVIRFPQLGGYALFAPFSNFSGKGPIGVGSLPGITPFGAYDMAGNVREWCFNPTENGRLVRGGAWNDANYMFGQPGQLPAMDRSAKNGFRLALYPEPEAIPEAAFEANLLPEGRDYYKDEPVSDSVFEAYRDRYSYDPIELNSRVESRVEKPGGWIQEKVTFDAAYGQERVIAHLFLPLNASPPYQAVIYFPGSGSLLQRSSENIEEYFEFAVFQSFLVKNGRAVVYPVYKGTFERSDPNSARFSRATWDSSHQYAEWITQVTKDFKRTIDYLETREDIDSSKLAYCGMSLGGLFGSIIPAVEDRLVTSVLIAGGIRAKEVRPEVDPVNFLGRIKIPTLMLNGRYDMILPYQTSIKPLYDLLGTPQELKELKLYDTDHIPPRNEFIRETLAWLDRYLGPVTPK